MQSKILHHCINLENVPLLRFTYGSLCCSRYIPGESQYVAPLHDTSVCVYGKPGTDKKLYHQKLHGNIRWIFTPLKNLACRSTQSNASGFTILLVIWFFINKIYNKDNYYKSKTILGIQYTKTEHKLRCFIDMVNFYRYLQKKWSHALDPLSE